MTLARALLPLVTAAVWLCGACSADRSGTTPRSDPTDLMDVSVEDVLPDDGPGEDAANDPNADSSGEEDSTALQDVATGEDTASDLRDDPRDLTEDGDETPTCVPAEGAGFLTLMTRAGAVEGSEAEGVRRWLGVPYAAPPVGSLRWRPPQPPPFRAALLRPERVPPSCPQRDPARGSFEGNEDCLFLNLWAPATPPLWAAGPSSSSSTGAATCSVARAKPSARPRTLSMTAHVWPPAA